MNIKTVTVIGATGTMGSNVAGIFASFGGANVYVVGRDIDKINASIDKIAKSVKADSIKNRLIPRTFDDLEDCVKASDLVMECVFEDIVLKKRIAEAVAKYVSEDTLICTGTSGLSVLEIAECYPESMRQNFYGVHMFNPPYSMPLCELVLTKYTEKTQQAKEFEEYLKQTLYRVVVDVKDSPAFLANRIGFHFINESLQLAVKYKDEGGIDYIDAILGCFTGRAMPPLATADYVGLDIHKAIVNNLHDNTNDYSNESFIFPSEINELVLQGKLGRKTKEGLYKTIKRSDGTKIHQVYDIASKTYRDIKKYNIDFANKMKAYISDGDYDLAFNELRTNDSKEAAIARDILLRYVSYASFAAKEVGEDIHSADDAMACGFNWCPPLAMNGVLLVDDSLPKSNYDYRKYFKAK